MNTRRTCPEIEPSLTAYLTGDLPAAKAAEVREHLEHCPSCRALAQELAHTLDLLRDALAASVPAAGRLDEARRARVLSSRPSKARRIWIGYLWPVARAALLVLAPLGLLFSLTLPRLGGHARYARTTAERAEEANKRAEAAMVELDGRDAPSGLGLDLAPTASESRKRSAGAMDFYYDHGTTVGGIGGADDGDGAPATAAPRAPLASTPLPAEPPAQRWYKWGMVGGEVPPPASAAAPAPTTAPAVSLDRLERDKSGAMNWDESAGGYTIADRGRGAADTGWKRQVDVKAAEAAGVTVSGAEPASGQAMVPLRTALPKPQFVGTPAPIKGVPHLEPESAARYNYAGGAGDMAGPGSGAVPAGPGAVNAPAGGTLAMGGGVKIVTAPEPQPQRQAEAGARTLGYATVGADNGRGAETQDRRRSVAKEGRALEEGAKSDSAVVTRGLFAGRSMSGREAAEKDAKKELKASSDAPHEVPALGDVPALGTLYRADGMVAGKPMTPPPPAPPPAPSVGVEVAAAAPEAPTDPFALPAAPEKPAAKAPAPATAAARPAARKELSEVLADSDADWSFGVSGAHRGEAAGEDRAKHLVGREHEKRDLSREQLGQQVALGKTRSIDHAARMPAAGSEAARGGIVAGDRLEVADLGAGHQKLNESEYLRSARARQPADEITKLKSEPAIQVERYDSRSGTAGLGAVAKKESEDRNVAKVDEKLKNTTIPSMEFRQANVNDALAFLQDAIGSQLPEGEKIRVVIKATADGQGAGVEASIPLITLNLKDVNARDALRYVTEVADLKYRIDADGTVVVTPSSYSSGNIVTRLYPVATARTQDPTGTVPGELINADFAALLASGTKVEREEKTKKYLESTGVPFPSGTSVSYDPEMNQLIARNTAENLEILEHILAQLHVTSSVEGAEPVPEIKLPPAEFNPYVDVAENAFSTFSIDVDTAAYTMSRKEILEGRAPAPETVRTEEFVNFFDYDYAAPAAGMFAVHTAMAPSPFRPPLELLKIGVQGRRLGREQERAAVLTLVIDTSGSMNTADRLGLIRQSLHLLLDKLAPEDRVALVQFASEPRLLLEHTPAAEKDRILAAVDSLKTSGSTQLEGGLKLGYETAARGFRPNASNRVLLMSDGVANLGAGDAEAILRTVEQFRKQGITCSVLGFGTGVYNDPMLEKLADKGDGQYVFIGSLNEARRVLVDNLAATLHVIASDVKIQVEFNPKRVKRFRQIGYENRKLTKEQFRDDTVDAGEVGSGQSVTALYDVELHGPAAEPVGTVRVRYRRADTGAIEEIAHRITATDRLPAFDKAPARYRLAAGVAEFAEKLRRSPYTDGTEFPEIENVLRPAALELSLDSNVQDLVRLVEAARRLPVQ